MKKKLVINCELCDARMINEDNFTAYEDISINTEFLFVNAHSKEVLNRLPVTINMEETLETENDIHLISINGTHELNSSTSIAEHTILCVNGCLNIKSGTEEILKRIDHILINGIVKYPLSLSSLMSTFSLNGCIEIIPDDCIELKSEFVIDKYFPFRARENGKYYAAQKVVLTDPDVDIAKLTAKNVHFVTKTFLVLEDLIESSIGMFDDTTDLQVIPSGYTLVDQDAVLDETLLQRYGNSLYINGNLSLAKEVTPYLERIERLHVQGNVSLSKNQLDAFSKVNAEFKELIIAKGCYLRNSPCVKVDMHLLENAPDGVGVQNCATVLIDEHVSAESIIKNLELQNCAVVKCTPEQKAAVQLVSKNVAHIKDSSEKYGDIIGGLLSDTKVINAEKYIL